MPPSVRQNLAGWGLYPTETCRVYRPDTHQQLQQLLASRDDATYISRGLGRSYGDAALNGEGLGPGAEGQGGSDRGRGVILHEQLDRFISFDPQTNVVDVEAGLSFDTLLTIFLPRGLFLPVTPGTRYVTVGGALAADVHGKNQHRDGSVSTMVLDLKLLTATGSILNCSRDENSDLFWATLGGMGLTGVIISARLQLMPIESAYVTVNYRKIDHLDNLLAGFEEEDPGDRYSVAWIDGLATGASLGRSVLMHGRHTPANDLPAHLRSAPLQTPTRRKFNVPCFMPSFLLNPLSVKAFNTMYYRKQDNKTDIVNYDSFFYPLDSLSNWNRLYGRRGFLQYQIVLPATGQGGTADRAGLILLLEKLAQSKRVSFLAVLKAFGPGHDPQTPNLSFAMPGHTLALDLANTGSGLLQLLDELDRIVMDHGGRVYLAKDARMNRQSFAAMYPHAPAFRQIKARVDPDGRFASSLARRIGLVDEPPQGGRT